MCSKNVQYFTFTHSQAETLEAGSEYIANLGGPQSGEAQHKVLEVVEKIICTFTDQQMSIANQFATGDLPVLVFQNLITSEDQVPDKELPSLVELENDFKTLKLASRNQILLKISGHRSFAFDMDNNGKLVRLVGNFKGGGVNKLTDESESSPIELSSYAGIALGPHTEATYHCSNESIDGHSPAPSSLILTARWNPKNEITTIIPMQEVIAKIGAHHALALTAPAFNFTRSDSFVTGKGEDGKNVSILDVNKFGKFSIRYNAYRFSIKENSSTFVKQAFDAFNYEISRADKIELALQPNCAVVINNTTTLHCRDIIKDNRRLLIRIFGYSNIAKPIVLCENPLLVKG